MDTESQNSDVRATATPGPWEVRVNGAFLRVVHGEHKITVADGIVSESNARLFAAAPELLEGAQDTVEALKLLRVGLAATAPEALPMIDAHIDELQYAIAKATGLGEVK